MQAARSAAYEHAVVLHRLACSQRAMKLRFLGAALDKERAAHEDDVDALLQTLEGLLEGDLAEALAVRDAAVAERDAAVTERDAAVTERDAAVTVSCMCSVDANAARAVLISGCCSACHVTCCNLCYIVICTCTALDIRRPSRSAWVHHLQERDAEAAKGAAAVQEAALLRRALQEAEEQRQMQQVPLPRAVLPGPVSGPLICPPAIDIHAIGICRLAL